MKTNFDNKLTDAKKREQERRTELAMLDLLMSKYPDEAMRKMRKLFNGNRGAMCGDAQ